MPAREVIYLLVLTANPDLVELYRQDCPECVVTIAKDAASAGRKTPQHPVGAVIIETPQEWAPPRKIFKEAVGGGPPLGAGGGTKLLPRAPQPLQGMCNGHHA